MDLFTEYMFILSYAAHSGNDIFPEGITIAEGSDELHCRPYPGDRGVVEGSGLDAVWCMLLLCSECIYRYPVQETFP